MISALSKFVEFYGNLTVIISFFFFFFSLIWFSPLLLRLLNCLFWLCNVTGGTIVLFDGKMLRNFRKDGHNWKKKKDGKTVKEAHEHLKVRFSPYLICFMQHQLMYMQLMVVLLAIYIHTH